LINGKHRHHPQHQAARKPPGLWVARSPIAGQNLGGRGCPAIPSGARTQMITGLFVAKRSALIVAKNVSTWFIFRTVRGKIVATSRSCVFKAAGWPGKLNCTNVEDTG
jgi:hypothetical protein